MRYHFEARRIIALSDVVRVVLFSFLVTLAQILSLQITTQRITIFIQFFLWRGKNIGFCDGEWFNWAIKHSKCSSSFVFVLKQRKKTPTTRSKSDSIVYLSLCHSKYLCKLQWHRLYAFDIIEITILYTWVDILRASYILWGRCVWHRRNTLWTQKEKFHATMGEVLISNAFIKCGYYSWLWVANVIITVILSRP